MHKLHALNSWIHPHGSETLTLPIFVWKSITSYLQYITTPSRKRPWWYNKFEGIVGSISLSQPLFGRGMNQAGIKQLLCIEFREIWPNNRPVCELGCFVQPQDTGAPPLNFRGKKSPPPGNKVLKAYVCILKRQWGRGIVGGGGGASVYFP